MATTTTGTNGAKAAKTVVRISAGAEKACRGLAKREGITVGEAAERLIDVGVKRLKALKKWSEANDDAPAAKPKAAKKNGARTAKHDEEE